ncbi:LEM-3-like GIY-YIG domain-containing protein [Aliiroseovarius sp. YM-037]|uniref:LEM-3-like GIY-YIG domain-containing protein n=1 Tax=Aliiroseovarius sp. YM-037 TaxID=3341728 RepID=UPI003A80BE37
MEENRDENFSSEVAQELKSYVYRLIDPRNGETFYVGKGKGNRVFAHVADDLSSTELAENDDDDVSAKLTLIREIRNSGLDVVHVIHRHGLDDATALEVEGALIDAFPGLSNLVAGHHNSDRGSAHAKQLIERYAAEDANIDDPIIEIAVRKSSTERSLLDAVRFAWRLSADRANRAKWVLAVENGIVIGVFEFEAWLPANGENFPEFETEDLNGRFGFKGKRASKNIEQKYLRKRVPPRKRGEANPVRYHNI